MSFLDQLRAFLRHPVMVPVGDLRRYRRRFLDLLEAEERRGADSAWLSRRRGQIGDVLDRFVYALEQQLLEAGIAAGEIPALVETAIAWELGSYGSDSAVEPKAANSRELILAEARRGLLEELSEQGAYGWRRIPMYAQEIRAVRVHAGAVRVTEIGRILLELTGIDAVKWLLHVEAALATGPWDEWRMDRGTAHALAGASPSVRFWEDHVDGTVDGNVSTFRRLAALDLMSTHEHFIGTVYDYSVHKHARPILREVGSDSDTPMSVLVASLLEDDLRTRFPASDAAPVSDAIVRQTRLVVHEISNALVPVEHALERILRAAKLAGIDKDIEEYHQRAARGIGRTLSFARELDGTARLAGEVADAFELSSVAREAIGVMTSEGHAPEAALPDTEITVMGVRSRLSMSLVTILRNAYQAAPRQGARVSMQVDVERGCARIMVDDNGPGVAPELRDSIFVDGYSTRPGGSGHGLALARATIEGEMGGTLSCEDGGSLGGARFVIRLPLHTGSAR